MTDLQLSVVFGLQFAQDRQVWRLDQITKLVSKPANEASFTGDSVCIVAEFCHGLSEGLRGEKKTVAPIRPAPRFASKARPKSSEASVG